MLNKNLLTPAEAIKIFGNVEEIHDLHQSLLENLKIQRKIWDFRIGVGICFQSEVHVNLKKKKKKKKISKILTDDVIF